MGPQLPNPAEIPAATVVKGPGFFSSAMTPCNCLQHSLLLTVYEYMVVHRHDSVKVMSLPRYESAIISAIMQT